MRPGPLSQQTDEQLAALGRGGSSEAFAEIVRRYEPVLRAKCIRIAGRSLADDALAQTWLQAFAALRRPRTPPVLKPWLHRVAYNCAIDQLRARRQQESLTRPRTHASDSAETELERKQSLRDLVKGLSTLPQNQRDALILRELEGWSYAQIAEWVEEPPSGIHQLIFRARSALRRGLCALAPWGPIRALAHHLAALAPTGGGGSLRFGFAMIVAAMLGGGPVTPGAADKPVRRGAAQPVDTSHAAPTRDAVRTVTSRAHPFVVLPAPSGPRTGGTSLRVLVWRDHVDAPETPAELVSAETPAVPETASPTVPSGEVGPSEPTDSTPEPAAATPAADVPGDGAPGDAAPEPGVTEPPPAKETPTELEPLPEEPAVAEPVPDDHPGRGHGPPPWAPARGHDKHASA